MSVEELPEDIGRRGLLQSLNVRAVLDESGAETGTCAVTAGGRRRAALQRLVRAKQLAKTAPVPCIVKGDGAAEEDSLAENTMRKALHPLDQFRAFQRLRDEHGMGDEEIAARFFVTPAVVRQRLKLASVSPKLLDFYAADVMSLEQLMGFTIAGDHARQEAVWETLSRGNNREPYQIRRMLTEGAVKATDKRAMFVGLDAYEAAGGIIERDLFQAGGGGYLKDVGRLERLVREKLDRSADEIRAQGWLWVEAAPDFPYGHAFGLRRLQAEITPRSDEEQAERARLQAEYDALEAEHAESEDLPEEADQRLGEIERRLDELDDGPQVFAPDEVARAGVFASIDYQGQLKVERGFVRPADEPSAAESERPGGEMGPGGTDSAVRQTVATTGSTPVEEAPAATGAPAQDEEDEDHSGRISDRLMTELTAHRTVALRAALSAHPDAAYLAVLHALALRTFYSRYAVDTCLELEAKSAVVGSLAPGLNDAQASRTLAELHGRWQLRLPRQSAHLWSALLDHDYDSRAALFAYCVGCSVNAIVQSWDRRPGAMAHADRLAELVGLNMAAEGVWTPTVASYLGRVTKAQILAAVSEAKGEAAAEGIA